MSITLSSNSRTTVIRIEGLRRLTRSAVEFAAYESGNDLVRATSKEILRKPKSGRVYIRRTAVARRRHRASAPGETHANMSGTLRKSLSFKASSREIEFGYGVQGNSAPEYAEWVEFGTVKMKARPSLRNGITSQRRNIVRNIERQVGLRLEGSGGLIS